MIGGEAVPTILLNGKIWSIKFRRLLTGFLAKDGIYIKRFANIQVDTKHQNIEIILLTALRADGQSTGIRAHEKSTGTRAIHGRTGAGINKIQVT